MSIVRKLNKSYAYRRLAAHFHKFAVKVSPEWEMKRVYRNIFNREPDLQNPKDLVEKIYWLQLHTDTSLWTKCADKYGLREYVEELGLGQYLPRLCGKWDTAALIDFDLLPEKSILKTNNGCAQCVIVDKSKGFNADSIRESFSRWLKVPYGYAGAQLHYTRIKPCIIAEELLIPSEEDKKVSPNSLIDYKVWCFNGQPECIWVAYNRHDGAFVDMDLYDTSWNSLSQYLRDTETDKYNPNVSIPKPACLNQMLDIASRLSQPFEEVRADFYVIKGKPVIGELTFTAGYGFYTDEFYKYLGSKVDLSKVNVIR